MRTGQVDQVAVFKRLESEVERLTTELRELRAACKCGAAHGKPKKPPPPDPPPNPAQKPPTEPPKRSGLLGWLNKEIGK